MLREFTCIMCPQGCEIRVDGELEALETIESLQEKEELVEGYSIEGNKCPKGAAYVKQELVNPMRNIATSILVEGGELPLASVRLNAPIPKAKIFTVMEEIKKIKRVAPVYEGEVIIKNVANLGSDVIVTKTVMGRK